MRAVFKDSTDRKSEWQEIHYRYPQETAEVFSRRAIPRMSDVCWNTTWTFEGDQAATQLHPDDFNIQSWFQIFSNIWVNSLLLLSLPTEKKEVKRRCGVEAMKAARRQLLPPVQPWFMTSSAAAEAVQAFQ